MRCPLHGEQAGKTCLACAAERERRERAHALLALTVALAIVLIVAISHYAPGFFPSKQHGHKRRESSRT